MNPKRATTNLCDAITELWESATVFMPDAEPEEVGSALSEMFENVHTPALAMARAPGLLTGKPLNFNIVPAEKEEEPEPTWFESAEAQGLLVDIASAVQFAEDLSGALGGVLTDDAHAQDIVNQGYNTVAEFLSGMEDLRYEIEAGA